MPMVVFQPEPSARTRQNPRSGSVFTDVKRNQHLTARFARADVHDEVLSLEWVVGRRGVVRNNPAGKRFAA
jgi:hypothetical protein